MNLKQAILQVIIGFVIFFIPLQLAAHEIFFCGERIPLTDQVAKKLMEIIKKQIRYNIVTSLKGKESQYMQTIEMYLEKTGLPDDLKYLAIVESGLRNVQSPVGAAGFWQIMPETARELGLLVNGEVDERNDINKATVKACRHLADNFIEIRKKFKISSWVLTAAAYNIGIGNISQAIRREGNNYFKMNLNKETSEYVYKIIAVKELFEYPELYMKDFGYNVFNLKATSKIKTENETNDIDNSVFGNINVEVNTDDGNHPEKLSEKNIKAQKEKVPVLSKSIKSEKFVFAHITGNYKNFKDGDEIKITLEDYLDMETSTKGPGIPIKGIGWKIDDKVFVDFGHGNKLILVGLYDRKHDGILISSLKDKEEICLKVTTYKK
ncbi:MAG: lytic transglycosylase domain-containing protein [Ferruginibacter sp.]